MSEGDPQGERWTAARRAAQRAAVMAVEFAAASAASDRSALLEAVVRGTATWAAASGPDGASTEAVRAAVLAAMALWPDADAAEAAWERAADVVFGGANDLRRSALTAAYCEWVQNDAAAAATWRVDAERRRSAFPADPSGSDPKVPPTPDDVLGSLCARYASQFPSGAALRTWRELADALFQLSAQHDPPSREIDETLAVALLSVSVDEPNRSVRRALIERIALLGARHDPPSPQIERTLAGALLGVSIGESDPEVRRALAERIATLSNRHDPPSQEIDEWLAAALGNATVGEQDPAVWRELAERIAPLSARYDPPSRVIDREFAAALAGATNGESDPVVVRSLAERIAPLSARHDPPSPEIDAAFSLALASASIREPDPAVRRALAERIAPLSARRDPPSRELDALFANELLRASLREADPAVWRELAERFAPLSARHDPPSRQIDSAFAAALANATFGEADPVDVRSLAERIAPLSARHDPPSLEIDEDFAMALANASICEPDPAVRRALAEPIVPLSARHDPPSRKIDTVLAKALSNATVREPAPAVWQSLAERIAPLSARHNPPSREIDEAFADALANATVGEPCPEIRRALAERIAPLSARQDPPSKEIDAQFAQSLRNAVGPELDPVVWAALAERVAPLTARHDPPSWEIDKLYVEALFNKTVKEPDPSVWQMLAEQIAPLSARHDPPSREIDERFSAALGNATTNEPDAAVRRALAERIAPLSARHDPPSREIDLPFAWALAVATDDELDPEMCLSVATRVDALAARHSPTLQIVRALGYCVRGRAFRRLGRRLEAFLAFCAAGAAAGDKVVWGYLPLLEFLLDTEFDPAALGVAEEQRRELVRSPAEAAQRLWTLASHKRSSLAALSEANLGRAALHTQRLLNRDRTAASAAAAFAWSAWLTGAATELSGARFTGRVVSVLAEIGMNAAQSATRLEDEAGAPLRRATESFLTAALAATERCPDGPARLAAGWALTDARLRLQTRDEAAFRAALAAAEAERRERLNDPDARGLYLPNVSRTLRLAAATSADETRSLEDRAAARRLAEAYAAVLPAHRLDAAVAAWSGAGAAEARAATAGLSRGPDPASRRTRAGPDEYRVQLCLDRDDPLLGAGITTLRDDGGTAESECTTFGAAHTDDLCKRADAAFEVFDLLQETGWAAAGAAERRRRAAKALGCEDAELAPLSESEMRERLSRHAAGLLAPLADAFFGHHAAERLRGRRVFLTPPPEWTGLPLWSLPVADARGERTSLADLAREVLLCPLPGGVTAPTAAPTSGTAWLCTAEFDPREAAPANAARDRDAWLRSLGGECAVYRVGGGGSAAASWAGRRTVHVTGHFDPAASSGGSRTNLADLIGEAVRGAPPAEWVLEMCGAGRAEQGAGVRRWAAAVVLLATGARRVVAPTLQVAPGSSFCRAWFAAYYAARAAGADAPVAARRAYDGGGDLGTVLERPDRWMPFVVFGA